MRDREGGDLWHSEENLQQLLLYPVARRSHPGYRAQQEIPVLSHLTGPLLT